MEIWFYINVVLIMISLFYSGYWVGKASENKKITKVAQSMAFILLLISAGSWVWWMILDSLIN